MMRALLLGALMTGQAGLAAAQDGGTGRGEEGNYGGDSASAPDSVLAPLGAGLGAGMGAGRGAGALALGPAATAGWVRALRSASEYCGRLRADAYVIDCLSAELQQVARQMPRTGDYAEARAVIENAARDLHRVARANADPARPPARARSASGRRSARALTPVAPARQAAAAAQASAIIAEAETILLRSAESAAQRRVPYTQIAQAVGSSKVLLRSL